MIKLVEIDTLTGRRLGPTADFPDDIVIAAERVRKWMVGHGVKSLIGLRLEPLPKVESEVQCLSESPVG